MKFTVSSEEFFKAVLAVQKVIPSDTKKPILGNVLLELTSNRLVLTATDEELSLRTSIAVADPDEDGSICVPHKNLVDLLKEMPDVLIKFKTDGNNSFICQWPNGEGQISYSSAEDYPLPNLEVPKNDSIITFGAEAFLKAVSTTMCATDTETARPALTGIFFDIHQQYTTLVGTDASQLVAYTLPEVKATADDSFILHKNPAKIITSIMAKDGGNVNIVFDEQKIYLQTDNVLLICRKIIGRYPAYQNVIPKNNSKILTIDRALLLSTIKRISTANKSKNSIRFDLHDNTLELSAKDTSFNTSAYEQVSCEWSSDESVSIAFNADLLVNLLSHFAVEGVKIAFADSTNRAVLITPVEADVDIKAVLVPTVVG